MDEGVTRLVVRLKLSGRVVVRFSGHSEESLAKRVRIWLLRGGEADHISVREFHGNSSCRGLVWPDL